MMRNPRPKAKPKAKTKLTEIEKLRDKAQRGVAIYGPKISRLLIIESPELRETMKHFVDQYGATICRLVIKEAEAADPAAAALMTAEELSALSGEWLSLELMRQGIPAREIRRMEERIAAHIIKIKAAEAKARPDNVIPFPKGGPV